MFILFRDRSDKQSESSQTHYEVEGKRNPTEMDHVHISYAKVSKHPKVGHRTETRMTILCIMYIYVWKHKDRASYQNYVKCSQRKILREERKKCKLNTKRTEQIKIKLENERANTCINQMGWRKKWGFRRANKTRRYNM